MWELAATAYRHLTVIPDVREEALSFTVLCRCSLSRDALNLP